MTNKFGLSRYIPADIARQVRQECGFGCVICGLAIAQYEHMDPPFAEAAVHDAANIALLCASCHDHVTRGVWSKQRVIAARKNPITFKNGCSHDAFEIANPFILGIGSNSFDNVRSIIQQPGSGDWFTIKPPEDDEAPPRITALFFDAGGRPSLSIIENEWRCPTDTWDMKVEGRTIEVRQQKFGLGLKLRVSPPHRLTIERLRMKRDDVQIDIDEKGLVVLSFGSSTRVAMEGSKSVGADAIYTVPRKRPVAGDA